MLAGVCARPATASASAASVRLSGIGSSLPDHVPRVPIVLFADALDEIGVRFEPPGQIDGPSPGISLRIVYRDAHVHMPDPGPGETFGYTQRFGSGQPLHVEPRS